jgi:Amidase
VPLAAKGFCRSPASKAQWTKYQDRIAPERLVFIDETWTKHGPAARMGAVWPTPHRQGPARSLEDDDIRGRTTLRRIDAPCLLDGPIDGESFRTYVERVLVPTLLAGDTVVMDNDQLAWPGIATLPGLPSTAIPTGFAPDGLPVGVQMVGPWLEDSTPLKLAELIEREFGCFVPPKMFDD